MPRVSRPLGASGVSYSDTEQIMTQCRAAENEGDSNLPPAVRKRLHELFGRIEHEMESLYEENQSLRQQVERLEERLEQSTGRRDKDGLDLLSVNKHGGTGAPATASPVAAGSQGKKTEKASNQISQKLKNTYKSHTSRLVSSFRGPAPSCQLKRHFRGHRDGVWEVSVARAEAQIIATASADHTCRLWWADSGLCLLQYLGHSGSVNSVRFHPNIVFPFSNTGPGSGVVGSVTQSRDCEHLLLTSSGDNTAHVWRAAVARPTSQAHDTSKASSEDELEFSEREEIEASESEERFEPTIVRQPTIELTGHMGVVIAADWLDSGSQAITASWDRTANIYDVESGEIVTTLTGHDQELTNVSSALSCPKLAVTSSKDTTFRLWDLRDPAMKVNVFQGHTQPVTSAVFAGSDKLVSGSDDRSCKVWDLKNMRSPITTVRTDSAINRLSVHPVTKHIALPHDNRHVRIYDINGERLHRLPRSNRKGHSRMVCSAAWSDKDSTLYTCGFDRHVFGWSLSL